MWISEISLYLVKLFVAREYKKQFSHVPASAMSECEREGGYNLIILGEAKI